MKVSYDKLADVLYVTFRQPEGRAEYIEADGGILRIDTVSREILGLTVPFFLEKVDSGVDLCFPEIESVPFNHNTLNLIRPAVGQEY